MRKTFKQVNTCWNVCADRVDLRKKCVIALLKFKRRESVFFLKFLRIYFGMKLSSYAVEIRWLSMVVNSSLRNCTLSKRFTAYLNALQIVISSMLHYLQRKILNNSKSSIMTQNFVE